jgi:hypothetical protein
MHFGKTDQSSEWMLQRHSAWTRFFFFLQYWGLNSGPIPWATPWAFFWESSWRTICLDWLQTLILLISASWVARVTGVSHQCPSWTWLFKGMNRKLGWRKSHELCEKKGNWCSGVVLTLSCTSLGYSCWVVPR